MGDIINLGRVKRARAKAEAAQDAAENRARHGRSKAERAAMAATRAAADRTLDGAALTDADAVREDGLG